MDRLVQAERAVGRPSLAERRRRQHPERAGQDGRLVGEDVAEQVLGDDDVEGRRAADEQHRARVDELVAQRHVREVGGDLVGDGPPQARRREDVGLVDRGHVATARPGQLEGEPDDPPDLRLRVRQRVERRSLPGRPGRLAALAEVDAAGELADDEQVDAVEELRLERRRGDERRDGR